MSVGNYLLIVLLVLGAAYAIVRIVPAVRLYLRLRGKRIVSCPETKQAAAVRVAAGKAALETTVHTPHLRLSECSRWPEKQACGQECLKQIEEAPKACLVWTIINQWYRGQECVYCRKPFDELHWHDHRPALRNEERKTIQWSEVPAEKLQEVLRTHKPVCWSCHIAETFRREHPELVVDRPEDPLRMSLYH